jgi:hypothetical protein
VCPPDRRVPRGPAGNTRKFAPPNSPRQEVDLACLGGVGLPELEAVGSDGPFPLSDWKESGCFPHGGGNQRPAEPIEGVLR